MLGKWVCPTKWWVFPTKWWVCPTSGGCVLLVVGVSY